MPKLVVMLMAFTKQEQIISLAMRCKQVLETKAAEGVEVRFMYDGMGNLFTLPHGYEKAMQEKGIQCKIFAPVRPALSSYQNNRDHRKICVIDGHTAFTGGVNLADEYINQRVRFGHWKDTAVMIKGKAVDSFTMMFLQLWDVTERDGEEYRRFLCPPEFHMPEGLDYGGFVMPYADSPLAVDELLSQEECLRQTIRAGLHIIGKMHAVMRTVAEELFEVRQVLRRGDDQDVTDARKHEHAERIVDHRLVIHRQQLLRRDGGQRVKAGAGTSGENDALHTLVLPWS